MVGRGDGVGGTKRVGEEGIRRLFRIHKFGRRSLRFLLTTSDNNGKCLKVVEE